jgi:hypothetical protein
MISNPLLLRSDQFILPLFKRRTPHFRIQFYEPSFSALFRRMRSNTSGYNTPSDRALSRDCIYKNSVVFWSPTASDWRRSSGNRGGWAIGEELCIGFGKGKVVD